MTVKKVADRCGVTGETLRYYERVGMLPPVTRTAGADPRLHGRGSEMGGTDALYAQGRTAAGGDVRLYREGAIFPAFARPRCLPCTG